MTAIRYRHPSRAVDIVLDDETPQSDEPIMVSVGHGVVNLTIDDAAQMYAGLGNALADAREWLAGEVAGGLRRPGQSLAEMLDEERASNDAVAKHERERLARDDTDRDAVEGRVKFYFNEIVPTVGVIEGVHEYDDTQTSEDDR